jgi:hypothetical protein
MSDLDLNDLPLRVPDDRAADSGGPLPPVLSREPETAEEIVGNIKGRFKFDEDRKPWDRQPEETDKSFAAFRSYLALGPDRTVTEAFYRHYDKVRGEDNFNANALYRWYHKYAWAERASAYDLHFEQKALEELERQRLQSRVETAELGQKLRRTAKDALDGLADTLYETKKVKDPVTGEVREVRKLKKRLSPNEIVKLAEAGAKLERLALGLDSDGSGRSSTQINIGLFNQVEKGDVREEAREVLEAQDEVVDVTAKLLGE